MRASRASNASAASKASLASRGEPRAEEARLAFLGLAKLWLHRARMVERFCFEGRAEFVARQWLRAVLAFEAGYSSRHGQQDAGSLSAGGSPPWMLPDACGLEEPELHEADVAGSAAAQWTASVTLGLFDLKTADFLKLFDQVRPLQNNKYI